MIFLPASGDTIVPPCIQAEFSLLEWSAAESYHVPLSKSSLSPNSGKVEMRLKAGHGINVAVLE